MTAYFACAFAGLVVYVSMLVIGAPSWAAFGFAYVSFLIWRTREILGR